MANGNGTAEASQLSVVVAAAAAVAVAAFQCCVVAVNLGCPNILDFCSVHGTPGR